MKNKRKKEENKEIKKNNDSLGAYNWSEEIEEETKKEKKSNDKDNDNNDKNQEDSEDLKEIEEKLENNQFMIYGILVVLILLAIPTFIIIRTNSVKKEKIKNQQEIENSMNKNKNSLNNKQLTPKEKSGTVKYPNKGKKQIQDTNIDTKKQLEEFKSLDEILKEKDKTENKNSKNKINEEEKNKEIDNLLNPENQIKQNDVNVSVDEKFESKTKDDTLEIVKISQPKLEVNVKTNKPNSYVVIEKREKDDYGNPPTPIIIKTDKNGNYLLKDTLKPNIEQQYDLYSSIIVDKDENNYKILEQNKDVTSKIIIQYEDPEYEKKVKEANKYTDTLIENVENIDKNNTFVSYMKMDPDSSLIIEIKDDLLELDEKTRNKKIDEYVNEAFKTTKKDKLKVKIKRAGEIIGMGEAKKDSKNTYDWSM